MAGIDQRARARVFRGFNLLEVAVASIIAGIVAVAALSSFAVLNRLLVRLQAESSANDDAKTLIDFLVTDLQGVGGGSVRPWMAIWLEDGNDPTSAARCARFGQNPCTDSDRITYALTVPATRSCPILGATNSTITSMGAGPTCCLLLLGAADRGGFADAGVMKMHTIAVRGNANRQLSLTELDLPTCTMRHQPGPLAGIDNKDGDGLLDDVDPDDGTIVAADMIGGTLSAVAIRTLYLDEATHELMAFEDRRDFAGVSVNVDPDERRRIASNVFDLQVQLGYDGNPTDGRLIDAGNTSDEWLYNAVGDALPTSIGNDDLRMTAVGVVVGVKVKDPNHRSSAQVVGGGVKSLANTHLRGSMGKAALRNVAVFF